MKYEARPHTVRHDLKEQGLWYIAYLDDKYAPAVKSHLTEFEARMEAAALNDIKAGDKRG